MPVSKTDPRAVGAVRAHGCFCHQGIFQHVCPAHILWAQRSFLRANFLLRHSLTGLPDADLPLCPDMSGAPCSKDVFCRTIREAARRLGLPLVCTDGASLWSGHSMRDGGAQSLAAAGLELWCVQLLERWGSSVIYEYVQSAPLVASGTWARRASRSAQSDAFASPAGSTQERTELDPQADASLHTRLALLEERTTVLERAREFLKSAAEEVSLQQRPAPTPFCYIRNRLSDVVHLVFIQPSDGYGQWLTGCGWQPASSAVEVCGPPDFHKHMCEKCFPQRRSKRKQALSTMDQDWQTATEA